jgi:catechol 2,3-dioxygenase-like lactoylglutathione lyase family enzyme
MISTRSRPLSRAAAMFAVIAAIAVAVGTAPRAGGAPPMPISRVATVGFTVSDMDRSVAFYTNVLEFSKTSDLEVSGRPFELLTGVAGARARIVRLALGDEQIELTEFHTPRGRPFPADARSNDRSFQHVAIIVSDMARAYARLQERRVEHASPAPQRLPDWNPGAGGIEAYYFRDPDRHFLEILHFPGGKGLAKWHVRGDRLFLGIDHTAIVVNDTDQSLAFYRDTLGFAVAGAGENYDVEQERLNDVFGARLRITALRVPAGPGIELLEYLAPRDGRPAPIDLHASDIAHWQTTIETGSLEALLPLARAHRLALVSPGPVQLESTPLGFDAGALARDADGHGVRVVVPAARNLSAGRESNR